MAKIIYHGNELQDLEGELVEGVLEQLGDYDGVSFDTYAIVSQIADNLIPVYYHQILKIALGDNDIVTSNEGGHQGTPMEIMQHNIIEHLINHGMAELGEYVEEMTGWYDTIEFMEPTELRDFLVENDDADYPEIDEEDDDQMEWAENESQFWMKIALYVWKTAVLEQGELY